MANSWLPLPQSGRTLLWPLQSKLYVIQMCRGMFLHLLNIFRLWGWPTFAISDSRVTRSRPLSGTFKSVYAFRDLVLWPPYCDMLGGDARPTVNRAF